MLGYKITCATDGKYLKLLYIDLANKHDLTIIKDRKKILSMNLKEICYS